MSRDQVSMLIVDDNVLLLSSLRRSLSKSRATIRVAGSVEEALDLIAVEVPDPVLSGYRMPGPVDGLSLLARIHAEHPGVRCVLHTGEVSDASLRVTAFAVLFKPCPIEVISELIESVRVSARVGTSGCP